MTAPQTKREISDSELDALLEKAVGARERREWEEKLRREGCALGDAIGIYRFEHKVDYGLSGFPTLHTQFCKCAQLPVPRNIVFGDVVEVNEGDHVPGGEPGWRKLKGKEAEDARSVEQSIRARRILENIEAAKAGQVENEGAIAAAEGVRDAAERRILQLRDESVLAARRRGDAEESLERFFDGRSPAWRTGLLEDAKIDRDARALAKVPPPALSPNTYRPGGGVEVGRRVGEVETTGDAQKVPVLRQ